MSLSDHNGRPSAGGGDEGYNLLRVCGIRNVSCSLVELLADVGEQGCIVRPLYSTQCQPMSRRHMIEAPPQTQCNLE